jgi:hypothetical protein
LASSVALGRGPGHRRSTERRGRHRGEHTAENGVGERHFDEEQPGDDVCGIERTRQSASVWGISKADSALVAAGVPVCVNADDPLLFGESLVDELRTCRDVLGVDRGGLANLVETSLRHAACPDHLRSAALDDLATWRTWL